MENEKVRAVVIGFGGMGRQYVSMIHEGQIEGMELAGVCCRNAAGQAEIKSLYPKANIYRDVAATFEHAGEFDAVVIVTPHTTHVEIGKMAAKAGKHILMDKPAGVTTKEVKELIAAAHKAGISFSMIFNTRFSGAYEKVKEMLLEGTAGKLVRAVWICNTWYRTPAYHRSAPWRSTWKGECGGLLINQCQHYLDIWQWLLGMPDQVYASVDYGKYNDFTVDDSVDLQFFYENGLHGTFISASGETPSVNRLELWGTKGRLCLKDGVKLTFDENVMSTEEFARVNTDIYGKLDHRIREISVKPQGETGYRRLFQNFTDHIRKGVPLLTDGNDGLRTLTLANGAYLSSWLGRKVDFPIDDDEYARRLEEKAEYAAAGRTTGCL